GHDLGVADLVGEQRREGGLAPEPLVRMAVDPDDVVAGQPDLVGDAAGPLERERQVEPGTLEGHAGPGLLEPRHQEPEGRGGTGKATGADDVVMPRSVAQVVDVMRAPPVARVSCDRLSYH